MKRVLAHSRRRIAALWGCRRGAAAVEFALMSPVLLAFILGIVEFGRIMWIRQTLQFAVESAVRSALADSTLGSSAIGSVAQGRLLGLHGVVPTLTVTTSSTQVSVSATYTHTLIAHGLLPFGPLTLTAQNTSPR